ncbi:glycosyltransferase family 2 protein [Nocardioides sp. LHG3406-4]|uniref:glycosyltransferase family 2 protein n=1 Tax=Nocardioides sp. LHG3406-4 TaxID=2804575 RepID=UPI003CFAD6B2
MARPAVPRVSVVVPALNEARHLELVLPALPAVHEVILVDGGSVDATVSTARRLRPDIRVIRQGREGRGGALAAGFAEVTGDVVVILDADGGADPDEIPRLVHALVDGADLAKGTRFRAGSGSHGVTRIRRLGNAVLNRLVNRVHGKELSDLCYGFSAFWADLMPVLGLPDRNRPASRHDARVWSDGFEIETVINYRFAVAGAAIAEVPSVERPLPRGLSNLHAVPDGLRVLRTLVTEWQRVRAENHLVLHPSGHDDARPRPEQATRGTVAS